MQFMLPILFTILLLVVSIGFYKKNRMYYIQKKQRRNYNTRRMIFMHLSEEETLFGAQKDFSSC